MDTLTVNPPRRLARQWDCQIVGPLTQVPVYPMRMYRSAPEQTINSNCSKRNLSYQKTADEIQRFFIANL
jgi:hypothetical protein